MGVTKSGNGSEIDIGKMEILNTILLVFGLLFVAIIIVSPIVLIYFWLKHKKIKKKAEEYYQTQEYKNKCKEVENADFQREEIEKENRRTSGNGRAGIEKTRRENRESGKGDTGIRQRVDEDKNKGTTKRKGIQIPAPRNIGKDEDSFELYR